MRKYPIGLQDFRGIRENGFVYVDKTRLIHTLIESGNYYFLSRPRRFGKSLLLSTVKEIFKGSKELFRGLWIEDHWNWEQQHPVIHIGISKIPYQDLGLKEALSRALDAIARGLGLELNKDNLKEKFTELIEKAAVKEKVVILIDEYDKPIIDYLDDTAKAEANRAIFKEFYSVLKDADEYIRLLLITGVSRFSKVSIFSDLNNLNDITTHPRYASLIGITQEELESNFAEEITAQQKTNPSILEELKKWYNGYSWNAGLNIVYNPFSLLSYMDAGVFQNYWIDTGTPTFLIKEIRRRTDLPFTSEDIAVGDEGIKNLNIENINPVVLLFQTGYLTIRSYKKEEQEYILTYPNLEVKTSTLRYLMSAYSFEDLAQVQPTVNELKRAITGNDIPKVIAIMDTLFATIPHPLWNGARESFFHGLIHNTFQLLGIYLESEVSSANRLADAIVKTPTHIYVIEFKLNSTPRAALDQISKQGYFTPYQLDQRKKVAVGINFSSKDKKIKNFLVKEWE